MTVREEYDSILATREDTGKEYCCPYCYKLYATRLGKDMCLDEHGFIVLDTSRK